MRLLQGKKIIVGICGGIAAYKILTLIRLLKKAGAEVKVIMTPSAVDFIGKLTPATLSEEEIYLEMFNTSTGVWTNHVELGLWADLFLIAPATAGTISKMTSGQGDNLLITTYLSARCPVFVAPAMDLDMWIHPATQANIQTLQKHKVTIIEPGTGQLASGLEGKGRMEEPEQIFSTINSFFEKSQDLKGKKVLITLGPTIEAIDPVRFISNHSTGKMGAEISQKLVERGADVFIVSGPIKANVNLPKEATVIKVQSAEEMYIASSDLFETADITILSAAVADYRPEKAESQKIKKKEDNLEIKLVKTKDIAAALGKRKKKGQFLLGFALETQNEVENAKSKIERKNLDAIVLNSMNDPGAGFGFDTNKIMIIDRQGKEFTFETKSKKEVANDIVEYVVQNLPKN
jgi:phosphopantothenoylcysteine decarboxylase/phosphopantothenate--cysteine ligase